MSTNRELLELAAKAAGIAIHYRPAARRNIGGSLKKFEVTSWHGPFILGTDDEWNPISDDGDALRLAVKLGLTVEILNRRMEPHTRCAGKEEEHRSDPYAATRRTIVRAAAEIGGAA
jgi:hypothetical protein